jgi:glycosyltransferase involved in cell wall biosynthesis
MRIVYCINNINDIGAIMSLTAQKANALSRIDGNEVWIIVTEDKGRRLYLDEKVHVVNLDINYFENSCNESRFRQLVKLVRKQFVHRKRLSEQIRLIEPDIIVSTEMLEKYIILTLPDRKKHVCVREVHKMCNYKSAFADTRYDLILARLSEFIDYRIICRLYDRIVVLTEDNIKYFRSSKKVSVIPNLVPVNHSLCSSLDSKIVVSAGRLCKSKNFVELINAFAVTHTQEPDWKLIIWGDGEEMASLNSAVQHLNLSDSILLKGFSQNLLSEFAGSSVFVSTSLSEGFSMVILEAMSCGLPVVAYDCPSGPRNIIDDGVDGFLVPMGNKDMLTDKLFFLMKEPEVRKKIGAAARKKAESFSEEHIIPLWNSLFCSLLKEKTGRSGQI